MVAVASWIGIFNLTENHCEHGGKIQMRHNFTKVKIENLDLLLLYKNFIKRLAAKDYFHD